MGLIGYGAVAHTLGYAIRARKPELAHAIAPWDGRVSAVLSEKMAGPNATAAGRRRSDQVARAALRADPTAVAAVATLGINAQIRGDTPTARRLFAYSDRLSRRDLRTRIWAVEYAVSRGDVAGALRHYDIALRTSRVAGDLLFPVMAAAISEAPIRVGLIKILAAKPPWASAFTDYLAGNDPDPRATAALFRRARQAGVPLSDTAQAAVIASLVTGGFLPDAWSYYASLRPGVDARRSRDDRFTADIGVPSLFDWHPGNDPGISASLQKGVFDFAAAASVGGTLLSQLQALPAGDYVLRGHSAGIEQPEGSRPSWVLRCHDGREFGRLSLPNSSTANGSFAGSFSIPPGCPAQWLSLVARPSDLVGGVTGQIDWVQLRPADEAPPAAIRHR